MKHTLESRIAQWFAMSDETWQRHANPWSVWTRFTVLPILVLSIWSRAWVGWWSLLSVAIAIAWAWLNPRIFPKPRSTDNWASRSVLGERVWLNRKNLPVPKHHRTIPKILSSVSGLGLPFIIWGLWRLEMWPTLVGCILVYAGKLWFLNRMVWIYEDMKDKDPEYGSWLYGSNAEEVTATDAQEKSCRKIRKTT